MQIIKSETVSLSLTEYEHFEKVSVMLDRLKCEVTDPNLYTVVDKANSALLDFYEYCEDEYEKENK